MRYYIADTHFFHEALNTRMDCRGFENGAAMNDYMLARWNGKVRRNDEVVILGDFSWGTVDETNALLDRLNGRLYFIRGNHDKICKDKDFHARRFVSIKTYDEMKDNKRKVVLCHYPIMCYNGQYRMDPDGNPKTYMLYGHVHDTADQRLIEQFQEITRRSVRQASDGTVSRIPSNLINCFCMYSDYTPLTLDEWILCDRERRKSSDAVNNVGGLKGLTDNVGKAGFQTHVRV